jgi:hypothetical protein
MEQTATNTTERTVAEVRLNGRGAAAATVFCVALALESVWMAKYPAGGKTFSLLGFSLASRWMTQKCHFTLGFCMLNFSNAGCPLAAEYDCTGTILHPAHGNAKWSSLEFLFIFLIHGQTPRTKRMSTKHTNSSFLKQEQRTTTVERYAGGRNRL